MVIGNYNFINNESLTKDTTTMRQRFALGFGVKLPTGHFAVVPTDIVSSANNQTGTGSVDFIVDGSYSLIIERWGMTGNIGYKINQPALNFRFGNRFDATLFCFHSYHQKENTFSPNIGLLFYNLNPNQYENADVASTGGYSLLGAAGMEMRFNKITTGFNLQYPLAENISDGQTKINLRGMIHLTFAF